jgi:hypothetical protein
VPRLRRHSSETTRDGAHRLPASEAEADLLTFDETQSPDSWCPVERLGSSTLTSQHHVDALVRTTDLFGDVTKAPVLRTKSASQSPLFNGQVSGHSVSLRLSHLIRVDSPERCAHPLNSPWMDWP